MHIGERLAELRKDNNYKQKEIAEHLSVGISTISNYETETHEPDLASLSLLADLYHVSTDYILKRTNLFLNVNSLNDQVYKKLTKEDFLSIMDHLTEEDCNYMVKTFRMLYYQQQLKELSAYAKEMAQADIIPPRKKRHKKKN